MARTIRFLVFTNFLLILPSCATPPAMYPRSDACAAEPRSAKGLDPKISVVATISPRRQNQGTRHCDHGAEPSHTC